MMRSGFQNSPGGLVAAYWRGKLSFLITMAIGLLGLRVLLAFFQAQIPPTIPVVLIGVWGLANLAIFTWQVVGAVRKTQSTQANTNDPILVWCGWVSIFSAIVITLFQAIDFLALSAPTREQILLANYTRPTLEVSKDGTIARITGDLNYNSNSGLLNALKEHPSLKTVTLESDGGLVFAARALAMNILKHKLNTKVENTCTSSCTLVFAAGEKRELKQGGRIGFHQYALATKYHTNTLDFEQELRKDREFFVGRGFTPSFVERIFDAPPDQMWYPTRSELVAGKVVTK